WRAGGTPLLFDGSGHEKPAYTAVLDALNSAPGVGPTPSPTPIPAGCTVEYRISSQWGTGFTAGVRVVNLGPEIDGWALGWTFPGSQSVERAWSATVTQDGDQVTATSLAHNARIASG